MCVCSPLALLVLEPLKYPISLGHFFEVSGEVGISEEQFLEKTFRRGLHESLVAQYVFLDLLC